MTSTIRGASRERQMVLWSNDQRVPKPLPSPDDFDRYRDAQKPRAAGSTHRTTECPDGRHSFDVVESVVEHELEDADAEYGYSYELEFRARLTCVRCGVVLAWEGRRSDDRHVSTLSPRPLIAGSLVAQMVHGDSVGGSDWSSYLVYRTTDGGHVPGGSLTPARGPRGRDYYVAMLDDWPAGRHVQGRTPAAALRALARAAESDQSDQADQGDAAGSSDDGRREA